MIPYIRENFRGGISDESTRGIEGSWKYAYGLDIHKRRDSLTCNFALKDIASSTTTDLIKYSVNARDGSTYAFGSAGSVYAISGNPADPVVTFVYNDENGEIKGAGEWTDTNEDTYLYWATSTSIARAKINGSVDTPWAAGVATQDYKVEFIESVNQHAMKNASGNFMIGNGNYMAMIDFSGVFNPRALNLRPGNIIKCLEERDDYVIIGSERREKSEEGHIWNWITTALKWVQKKKIPVKGVNALIDTELLLLQGGTDGELFFSDFENTSPLVSVPQGGQINPDGVTVLNDLALLGIYGAGDESGLYSYGRRNRNRPFALNHEFRMSETASGNTVKEIGSVWMNSSVAYASWKVEGSATYYGIDMVSTSTRASARLEGLEFSGGSPHLKKEYRSEKIVMEPLPSGTSLSVVYKTDRALTSQDESGSQGGGWRYARVGGGTSTSFSTANATEADFTISDKGRVFELGIELEPSGLDTPEVTALVGYLGENPDEF